jgi:hypothetical protein
VGGHRVDGVTRFRVVATSGRGAVLSVGVLVLAGCGTMTSVPPGTTGPAVAVVPPTCPEARVPVEPYARVTPARPGSDASLVPPGPAAASVCRFAAAADGRIARSAAVSRADLGTLVSEFDSTDRKVIAHPGIYDCPRWDGATDVVRLAYPSGPGVDVTIALGGCGFA